MLVIKNAELIEQNKISAIGVNSIDAFIDHARCTPINPCVYQEKANYELLFQRLIARSISIVRTCVMGVMPKTYEHYRVNPSEYYQRMDDFLDCAEKYGIKLIISLFFSQKQIAPFEKEPLGSFGVSGTKTKIDIGQFGWYFINRYKDRRSILFVEAGNEHDIRANKPIPDYDIDVSMGTPATWDAADMTTFDHVKNFNAAFHRMVKAVAPSMLTATGCAGWRPYIGVNVKTEWAKFWDQTLQIESTDLMSFHPYCEGAAMGDYSGVFNYEDYRAYISKVVSAAKLVGKIAYIGEIGINAASKTYDDPDKVLIDQMNACVEAGSQLTLLWQWSARDSDSTYGLTYPSYASSTRLRVLDAAEAINRRLGNT